MFHKKLPLAVVALGTVVSSYGTAAESQNDEFQLNLNLRTFYMNRDFDSGIPDTIAAGQAFKLDLVSPYWGGIIGFDATAVHVAKLEGDKTENSSDVLTPNGDGYSSIEQAYVKIKPLDNVHIKAGRMVMMTPLLNDLTSRLSAPSTQAVYATADFENAGLYAFYSDQASMNNSEDYEKYTAANGEDYAINSIGATYQFANGLSTHLQYAVADDYLQQSYVNLTYPTKLADYDLTLDLRHLRGEDDGALFGRDYDSHLTGLTARLAKGNWAYTVAYQTVGGSDGYNLKWGGQDHTQYFTYGAIQLLDFEAKDEQSLQFRVDYNVPSVPGLHLMARHTESWDIDHSGGDDGQRRETNLDAKYTVQSGKAKDLSLHLRVAHAEGEDGVLPRISDIRLILDYPVNLL